MRGGKPSDGSGPCSTVCASRVQSGLVTVEWLMLCKGWPIPAQGVPNSPPALEFLSVCEANSALPSLQAPLAPKLPSLLPPQMPASVRAATLQLALQQVAKRLGAAQRMVETATQVGSSAHGRGCNFGRFVGSIDFTRKAANHMVEAATWVGFVGVLISKGGSTHGRDRDS
eukprot:scaffold28875_cov27-Tisochrysis_lutea.AAC.1